MNNVQCTMYNVHQATQLSSFPILHASTKLPRANSPACARTPTVVTLVHETVPRIISHPLVLTRDPDSTGHLSADSNSVTQTPAPEVFKECQLYLH